MSGCYTCGPRAGESNVRLLSEPWRQAISRLRLRERSLNMMRSPKKKKKKHLYPHQPEHMSVGATLQEGEDRTGGYGQQQTNVHIFGFNRSTGGDSMDHRCTCLGNNWA